MLKIVSLVIRIARWRSATDAPTRAREAAGDDVPQDGPPNRSGAPARPDDRDRSRGQHVPQARYVSRLLSLGDGIA
jgi:hypothetical protein